MMGKDPLSQCLRLAAFTYAISGRRCGASWVDPDTPKEAHATEAYTHGDDREYELVFSDEFEVAGRSLADGDDPRWTALNKNDYTNEALHFYSPENVRTENGVLNITTIHKTNKYKAFNEKTKKFYVDAKHIQSGMVQGWNKFCITGGIVEFSAKLPGDPTVGGLWPALWMLGNLARGTYVGSSDYVWPFSYNECSEDTRNSQKINACDRVAHYSMEPGRGRGSPEIDLLEAMMGEPGPLPNTPIQRPYFSTSLQVAPGIKENRPQLGHQPKAGIWYEGLEYGKHVNSSLNPFFYGVTLIHEPKSYTYQSDAISANTHIGQTYFDDFHDYRVEWEPPERNGTGGYLRWYLDKQFVFGIQGESLSLTGTEIPSEPMYLLMNTAVATTWGFPLPCPDGCDCDCYECGNPDCSCGFPQGFCSNVPAHFEIEHVRVWQAKNESKHVLGCSTEDRPTAHFIEGSKKNFMESGDKEPLKQLQNGGGPCHKDSQCGGTERGKCTPSGRSTSKCVCNEEFTGPMCLAHNGFYDHPYIPKQQSLKLQPLSVPLSMAILAALIAIGFGATLFAMVRQKRKEDRDCQYRKVQASPSTRQAMGSGVGYPPQGISADAGRSAQQSSYQNQNQQTGNSQTSPSQATKGKNVRTYCMIDGRLIDE